MIEGVQLSPQKIIAVEGGDVLHGLKATDPGFRGFGEAYFSTIENGCVKAWKMHKKMVLNFLVPVGRIRFVIHDTNQPGVFDEITLSRENYQRLTIQPGLWVGFTSDNEGPNLLMNLASIPHDPDEIERLPSEAFGYAW